MERDFRYLRDQHGEAGAREIFEKICTDLFQSWFGSDAHNVRVSQGDEGIDVLVGDFTKPIDNYQCKYFIDGLGDSQKSQIRDSFKRAIEATDYTMKTWVLCVPCTLSAKEFKWWSEWSGQKRKIHGIDIALYDGGFLISQLKRYDIYDRAFDDDVRIKIDEILSYIESEKARISEEIILLLDDLESDDYGNMLFVKKLENAKISLIDGCKRDFFNAEFAEYIIKSKGDPERIRLFGNLKRKVHTFWETQYRRYQDETDGNDLLTRVYERIEDADTTTLSCSSLPEVSMIAKKGMLHQWAEECSVGWLKDYKNKLEEYLQNGG